MFKIFNIKNFSVKKSLLFVIVIFLLFIMLFTSMLTGLLSMFFQDNSGGDSPLIGVPEEYIPYFNKASQIYNMPNWNPAAIAKQESNFNPYCSYEGAYGMMQIMDYDWSYYIKMGLGDVLKKAGYSFSSASGAWQIYLKDARMQILSGTYELRFYTNYVLYKKNKTKKLEYNSNENMKLIDWYADENDADLRELLRRSYAVYNGGAHYGMTVDLDKAQNNYPNNVYKYAMEFRSQGTGGDIEPSDNELINKFINAAMAQQGKPYKWGATGPDEFDCSGLVQYCAKIATGKLIERTANEQMNACQSISFDDLEVGDLVFRVDGSGTAKHVQIYIGNGKVVHAPQTGDVVKVSPVPHGKNRRYGRHPVFKQTEINKSKE